jgi:flagellar FliL protein
MSAAETKAAPPAAGGAPKDAGGGNKLVLILSLVNVLATFGIAGVLVVSFLKEKKETSVTDIAEGAPGDHGADAGGHGEAKKEGEHGEAAKAEGGHGEAKDGHGAPATAQWGKTVTLDQFTVNLTSPGSATPKFVRVNISLEVPDTQTEQEVVAKMAQIRNVIIDLFNSKRPSDLATGEGRDYLKEEIKNAINGFMVSGKVKGVFFTNFALTT